MTPRDWKDLRYLLRGTTRQRAAYRALQSLGVFRTLRKFDPVLVGTIPLDIDIPGSDLDIICEARDLGAFETTLVASYGGNGEFRIQRKVLSHAPSVVTRFTHDDFPIEIVGQPKLVTEQQAFRHMVIEARLLCLAGEQVREVIRGLKRTGMKTEPAFARWFGIPADPYQTLLEWYTCSDEELKRAISQACPSLQVSDQHPSSTKWVKV